MKLQAVLKSLPTNVVKLLPIPVRCSLGSCLPEPFTNTREAHLKIKVHLLGSYRLLTNPSEEKKKYFGNSSINAPLTFQSVPIRKYVEH